MKSSNVLTVDEEVRINSVLDSFRAEIELGEFCWRIEDEDIHMTIERVVTEKLGDLGKKMHLGRSRNDLIATTMKLYLSNSALEISRMIEAIMKTILSQAQRDVDILIASYTHYQAAQPVRMAHIWNFHGVNFVNDIRRLTEVSKNLMEMMPLGSGAISGTHLEIDLQELAKDLGFVHPPFNSIHGVSDRDGILDFSHALAVLALHVVRLCDDLVFWSSSPLGIIKLGPEWSSGSSMMPNKRNPDFFEIMRAKFKKISLTGNEMISLSHGFISGYASDFHEQKRIIISTINYVQELLIILPEALQSLTTDYQSASKQLLTGQILATELANEMVEAGIPFRDAYSKVAQDIALAEKNNEQVGIGNMSFVQAVERRNNCGGTSLKRIEETMSYLRLSGVLCRSGFLRGDRPLPWWFRSVS